MVDSIVPDSPAALADIKKVQLGTHHFHSSKIVIVLLL